MEIARVIFDEEPAAGGALPSGARDPGDEQTDLIAGFVALDCGVAAVFDEPVESLEKRIPLLVRDQVGFVGKVVSPVFHDFTAVALDFHGNDVGEDLLASANMLRKKARRRQEWDGGLFRSARSSMMPVFCGWPSRWTDDSPPGIAIKGGPGISGDGTVVDPLTGTMPSIELRIQAARGNENR